MNKDQLTLLNVYSPEFTQRELASLSKFSLGKVNKVMASLKESGIISKSGLKEVKVKDYKVNYAILLAAGFGLRMMPLDKESPKALLKVNGEVLIERLIYQLKQKGITTKYESDDIESVQIRVTTYLDDTPTIFLNDVFPTGGDTTYDTSWGSNDRKYDCYASVNGKTVIDVQVLWDDKDKK